MNDVFCLFDVGVVVFRGLCVLVICVLELFVGLLVVVVLVGLCDVSLLSFRSVFGRVCWSCCGVALVVFYDFGCFLWFWLC